MMQHQSRNISGNKLHHRVLLGVLQGAQVDEVEFTWKVSGQRLILCQQL